MPRKSELQATIVALRKEIADDYRVKRAHAKLQRAQDEARRWRIAYEERTKDEALRLLAIDKAINAGAGDVVSGAQSILDFVTAAEGSETPEPVVGQSE